VTAFAAIADDLTGACDVAAELAAAGQRVRVVVEPGGALACDDGIVIVNTQSRSLRPDDAAGRVRDALRGRTTPMLLKKIDTALRGHLGAELDAACDVLGAAPAFVVAAIPAAGRVTRGGCQWFGGRPLADTEFARDPEGPGAISSIPDVLARESQRPAAVVSREVVRTDGLAAEVARRRAEGVDVFVMDAETDDDVRAAVDAILALPRPACLAGSIALAAALAASLQAAETVAYVDPGPLPTPALVVSGSLHSRARAQLDAVLAAGKAVAVSLPASDADAAARNAAVSEATRALAGGTTVVLAAPPTDDVPTENALRATERCVAETVAAIAATTAIPSLVLIGGETSYAVLVRLAAGAIEVHGRIAPLVAHGTILEGPAAGTRLVTKGGSGGGPDVVAAALASRPAMRAAGEAHG
jgi:uncharacterized protein YgbK (DUF1537 family)